MVESRDRDTHFVDIPLHDDHALLLHHPLKEISESPGHLLLLKLWQRKEFLSSRRIARRESLLHDYKRDIFRLCSLFFSFHVLFLTLLFTCSAEDGGRACRGWWVPGTLSAATSTVIVCAVQARVWGFWRVSRDLQRERGEARALQRCVQELRMKGRSFDLAKEPQVGKRMKSSSVEVKWRLVGLCLKNLVSILLLCLTGVVVPACKFMVCG